jgi:hypothetical protein
LPFYGDEDDSNRSAVRILDSGGLIWESERPHCIVAETLTDAEQAFAAPLNEN